jgi:hypothetical protein
MKAAVIYKSKYGSTKKYAEWIAEELNCPLFEFSKVNNGELGKYDTIIYGGGLYAGSISGVKDIAKNYSGRLVVFAVGLTPPGEIDLSEAVKRNGIPNAKLFQFRGGYIFDKLSPVHKLVMRVVRKAMTSKAGISAEERTKLYGNVVDYTDRTVIAPLIQYVKEA